MQIGKLNERVTFQKGSYTKTADGGTSASWSDQYGDWAAVEAAKGRQLMNFGQKINGKPYVITTRSRFDYRPDEQWRIEWRGRYMAIVDFDASDLWETTIYCVESYRAEGLNNAAAWNRAYIQEAGVGNYVTEDSQAIYALE